MHLALSTTLSPLPVSESDRQIVNGELLDVLVQCEEILSHPWMELGHYEKVLLFLSIDTINDASGAF